MRTLADDLFGFSTRKKGINSKKKGNKGERLACNLLTAWTGRKFNRVPSSGGLNWVQDSRISGDVVGPLNFDNPFTIEIKNYKDLGLDTKDINDVEKSTIARFWKQSVKDSERVDKIPLLMVRSNGFDFYLITLSNIEVPGLKYKYILEMKNSLLLYVWPFKDVIGNLSFDQFKNQLVQSK